MHTKQGEVKKDVKMCKTTFFRLPFSQKGSLHVKNQHKIASLFKLFMTNMTKKTISELTRMFAYVWCKYRQNNKRETAQNIQNK